MKKIHLLFAFLLFALNSVAQFTISGKVTDDKNKALIGASVALAGTSSGVITNTEGNYKLENIKAGTYELKISYIGYEDKTTKISVSKNETLDFVLQVASYQFDDVIVAASRADDKTPIAHTNVDQEELKKHDLAKDLPMLIASTPSVVTTSDAGAGVGYTGIRIRGTDISRINVTINGVPLNDPESHGVFWVNMPDFAGNVSDIQIQRGVGTSSNGAAAFGASIDLKTISATAKPFGEVAYSYGTFNTQKISAKVGTGLIKDKFAFNLRLSQISSDGFIDRATSDLKSFYATGGYFGENSVLKVSATIGKEKTYQAWNGVPKVKLLEDAEGIENYIAINWYDEEDANNLRNANTRTYNQYTYENETDNYVQGRYQLIFNHQFSEQLKLNTTLFYTRGKGYYEQYKKGKSLEDYNLPITGGDGQPVEKSDLIQQKWLDNHFYGANYHLTYQNERFNLKFGQSYNNYDGDHFGKVIRVVALGDETFDHEWYRSNGTKKDFSTFAILNWEITKHLRAFFDLQYRFISYRIKGTDDDYPVLDYDLDYHFINPKTGLYAAINDNHGLYFSYSRGNREPNRANIIDTKYSEKNGELVQTLPKHETLNDYELGYKLNLKNFNAEMNVFYMDYNNQLALTGEMNDVGTAIVENVENSYRLGVEISAAVRPVKWFTWSMNTTLSRNRILDFKETVPILNDWWVEVGNEAMEAKNTDISFSPNVIFNNSFSFEPVEKLHVSLNTQYVGRQFIDNTSTKANSLDPYLVNDLNVSYEFKAWKIADVALRFTLHNLLNEEYEANAWIWKVKFENATEFTTLDGYFPQAGRHFLLGATVRF